jgi:hypothetical protein
MQMKVGSLLVKDKLVTEAQLEEALRNQVIFGGRIGTNLIELGYITADQMAEYLSRHKGVPQARPGDLHSIPPEVIALVPAEIAKKHQVLPIRLDKKRLSVAMADPSDLETIDKLSFMTGMYINPLVIPELMLIMALERYYKIKRETRYIAIARDMRREPRPGEPPEPNEIPAPAAAEAIEPAEEDYIEIPEFAGFHKVEIPEAPEPEKAETDVVLEGDEYSLTDMCSALAGATSRDEIGEALMEYLRRRHFRAALLLPKEPVLTGWLAAEENGYVENFSDFRIEMEAPSLFLQAIESKNFSMGQLLGPSDLKTASALGAKDNPAILLPIVLMNRVVAILCVVDTLEHLTRSLNELQKIAIKSAMAFEILIMRNKIQMV